MGKTTIEPDHDRNGRCTSKRSGLRRVVSTAVGALLAAIVGVAILPGMAGAVQASDKVDQLLALYPGSTKVDAKSVEIEPGVVASLPSDIGVQATCDYYYLCLYSANNHSGYKLSLYTCAFRNLGDYSYPGGGRWNDKMSSLINNQTDGTRSLFYNYIGSGNWDHRFTSTAFNSRTSLGSNDNLIDGVRVC